VRTFALLWAVCIAVLLARRPDLLTMPQFYAEDGVVFFRDAVVAGVPSIFISYAGYHQLVSQAVALIASPLPFTWQPASYVWATIVMQSASCAALAPLLRSVVGDPLLRGLAALAVAASVPANELIGSVSNLQWYLALPALASSLVPLAGRTRTAARIAAVVVGLTTPLGLLAVPVAAALWWRKPPGRDPWIATLYATSSLLNIVTAARDGGGRATPQLLDAIASAFAFRVADAVVLGKSTAVALATTVPLDGVALGLAIFAAAIVVLARAHGKAAAAVAAYVILGPVVLVFATRSLRDAHVAGYAFFGADRYFVTPSAALVVALVMIASRIVPATAARAVAVALLFPGALINFHEPQALPDERWAAHAAALDEWRAARDAGGPVREAKAPIPPEHWYIALPPCGAGSRGGPLPLCP
jgi:hypothetical protein